VPVLLLLLLVVFGVALLALLLLPVSLWARYRNGRARRRAQGWAVRTDAWLLALSAPLFLASAWLASLWLPQALADACYGLLAGVCLGIVGLWLTRFEHDDSGFHFTPNRWVVLVLIVVVAARIAVGMWLTAAPMLGLALGATWHRDVSSLLEWARRPLRAPGRRLAAAAPAPAGVWVRRQ
jgi:hypothetical protein